MEARKYDFVTFAPQAPWATVAALGSTVTDAAALTAANNNVTGGDGTVGVKLPAITPADNRKGITLRVYNNSGSVLKVYSAAGGNLNGGSTDAAVYVATKTFSSFTLFDDTSGVNVWVATEPAAA